jgi:hypothetical protein
MINLNVSSVVRQYTFQVENTTTDKISGTNYFPVVVFDRATEENPSFPFEVSSVIVRSAFSSNESDTKDVSGIFFNAETGTLGIEYSSPAVGDVISVLGSFVRTESIDGAITPANVVGASKNLPPTSFEYKTTQERIFE